MVIGSIRITGILGAALIAGALLALATPTAKADSLFFFGSGDRVDRNHHDRGHDDDDRDHRPYRQGWGHSHELDGWPPIHPAWYQHRESPVRSFWQSAFPIEHPWDQAMPISPIYLTANGRYCRDFQWMVLIWGRLQPRIETACLHPNGTWRFLR
jgi:hypothetical protein